jgi:hypothetical protein
MQETYEESQSRQIAYAMYNGDTRIGMAQLRATEQPFLMEFVNSSNTTTKALRDFFTNPFLQEKDRRLGAARSLAETMLEDNPTHHSLARDTHEHQVSDTQRSQAVQTLAERLMDAATPKQLEWFYNSAVAQVRGK